jgi:hypothetical protein
MTRLGVYSVLGLLHAADRALAIIHIHKNGDLGQCDGVGSASKDA